MEKLFDWIGSVFEKKKPVEVPSSPKSQAEKNHPWRLCPVGQHWVTKHPLTVPISEKNPDGTTLRRGHCADNPARRKLGKSRSESLPVRDYLGADEVHAIADTYFRELRGAPKSGVFTRYSKHDAYDSYIRGWVKYWNEVLPSQDPLDPDFVKALIASESSFEIPKPRKAGKAGMARGLIQITDEAILALKNPTGEIRGYYIEMSPEDMNDPNLNICSGVRWLFYKKKWAANKLKKNDASWIEAVEAYKGYLLAKISGKNPNPKGMKVFKEHYDEIKK